MFRGLNIFVFQKNITIKRTTLQERYFLLNGNKNVTFLPIFRSLNEVSKIISLINFIKMMQKF